jgi:hypothetical protein
MTSGVKWQEGINVTRVRIPGLERRIVPGLVSLHVVSPVTSN